MPRTYPLAARAQSEFRRVAVLRALQLGDMLCAVPALRALRAALPEAEVVLVGLPWARELARRYPAYLDGFREFPGFPGLPERNIETGRIPAFLADLQAERFDLAVQLHGSGRITNPLVQLFGARQTAGFFRPGDYCPDANWFAPWPEQGLEVRRLLALTEFLGVPACGEALEFPLGRPDFDALHVIAEARALSDSDYVCIHAGASCAERRWPAERFAAVARALAGRGFRIVLTGTAAEAPLTRVVAQAAGVPCSDLAGRTDLGAAGALLSRARLLVCNDTGISHLAAALRVPSVVISTGQNPERWAPTDTALHRVLCRDEGVETSAVLAEAEALLRVGPREPVRKTA